MLLELIFVQSVWNYTRGMLQNLGQINFTRLEKMLMTFGSFNPQLKIDSPSLAELLHTKKNEGLITLGIVVK